RCASSQEAASRTSNPWGSRKARTPKRIASSSSTIKTTARVIAKPFSRSSVPRIRRPALDPARRTEPIFPRRVSSSQGARLEVGISAFPWSDSAMVRNDGPARWGVLLWPIALILLLLAVGLVWISTRDWTERQDRVVASLLSSATAGGLVFAWLEVWALG